jgi:hypothetical protein
MRQVFWLILAEGLPVIHSGVVFSVAFPGVMASVKQDLQLRG